MMSKRIIKLLYGKNNTLCENILICLAVVLFASFAYYDHYNTFFAEALRIVAAVAVFVTWVFAGFSSGKNKRWGFLIFTALYWIIPNAYMLFYASRDNVREYSKWLSFFNKTADILVIKPFRFICEKLGGSEYLYTALIVVVAVSAYFIGRNLIAVIGEKAEEA